MPTPRSLNTVEFGWNGTDGYVKNDGKYQLLYTKPNLSFPYGVATYSSDPTVADIVLDQYGDLMEVTPEMEAEMSQYAITCACWLIMELQNGTTLKQSLRTSLMITQSTLIAGLRFRQHLSLKVVHRQA
ncbi:hypothetical protein VP3_0046 [Vibrio phage VP3]|uniref:Uncharacterized protein n=1 Tax=Vibrio phage VP3 TaxID=588068 RepID=H9YAJ4_9CAUD|nr:hypothetical protein VP3_0046 [Vibrio phage VP3]